MQVSNKTEDEILTKSAEIWNLFIQLEPQHPDERNEMKDAIHKVQAVVAQRMIQRIFPDKFPIYKVPFVPEVPSIK